MAADLWLSHRPVRAAADGSYVRCEGCEQTYRRDVFVEHIGRLLTACSTPAA